VHQFKVALSFDVIMYSSALLLVYMYPISRKCVVQITCWLKTILCNHDEQSCLSGYNVNDRDKYGSSVIIRWVYMWMENVTHLKWHCGHAMCVCCIISLIMKSVHCIN